MVSNIYYESKFPGDEVKDEPPQLVPVDEKSSEQQQLRTLPGTSVKANVLRVRELKPDKMVEAWDKIGILTKEVTKSIMKKQADSIAKRYRQGAQEDHEEPCTKKQRLEDSPSTILNLTDENGSESLTRCIDRMARMSKLIMEIEYCHRLLREEMVEIQNDLAS